jgi:hypothetical protein
MATRFVAARCISGAPLVNARFASLAPLFVGARRGGFRFMPAEIFHIVVVVERS